MLKRLVCLSALSVALAACTQPQQVLTINSEIDRSAHWLKQNAFAVNEAETVTSVKLYSFDNAEFTNSKSLNNAKSSFDLVKSEQVSWKDNFPHLNKFSAYQFDTKPSAEQIKDLAKQQLLMVQLDSNNKPLKASLLQFGNLLDDLYTSGKQDADEVIDLGATLTDSGSQFKLWSPTARKVTVKLFNLDKSPYQTASVDMEWDQHTGMWSASLPQNLSGIYYQYDLELYHPESKKIEQLTIGDPYSLSLSRNSVYSQVIDLSNSDSKPQGWDEQPNIELAAPEDAILYETHIGDFSGIEENLSNPAFRGKYKAFLESDSDGIKHLQRLKNAGLNHIHLLPTFDIGTVNEDPEQVVTLEDNLSKLCIIDSKNQLCDSGFDKNISLKSLLWSLSPTGTERQQIISALRPFDNYNWGYDPFHYTVPEGSYAVNPEGVSRIVEFREMVQRFHEMGFRVVMDVVYNHTYQAKLSTASVFDKAVPEYYHRLNPLTGSIEQSTCCDNTATERRMMAKLMIDSLVIWAKEYKIDGFRFDLMGHQPKAAMLEAREVVRAFDPDTYFYGEGWDFGEVANNAQFIQASQTELAGTEIGTFTDRLRDAVRGGSSFVDGDDLRFGQGIGSGLLVIPNELQPEDKQREEYLLSMDQVRVGLAGNLVTFPIQEASGNQVTGKDIPYGNTGSGYALDPADTINYVSKHDNQTLWDNNQYRNPFHLTADQRVRLHNLSLAYPLMAQGIPFLHMGGEFIRSKSFLRDSYDYNDWFNAVDFSKQSNNYNVGLPPAEKDEKNWEVIKRLLTKNEGRDKVSPQQIQFASEVFAEFIAIRSSTKLLRLETAKQVNQRIKFHNTGPEQVDGLILMSIDDSSQEVNLDKQYKRLVVAFNNSDKAINFPLANSEQLVLHPVQQNGIDQTTKSASSNNEGISVPALTVAVFVEKE